MSQSSKWDGRTSSSTSHVHFRKTAATFEPITIEQRSPTTAQMIVKQWRHSCEAWRHQTLRLRRKRFRVASKCHGNWSQEQSRNGWHLLGKQRNILKQIIIKTKPFLMLQKFSTLGCVMPCVYVSVCTLRYYHGYTPCLSCSISSNAVSGFIYMIVYVVGVEMNRGEDMAKFLDYLLSTSHIKNVNTRRGVCDVTTSSLIFITSP